MKFMKMVAVLLLITVTAQAESSPSHTKTENVILVMTDGLRWQEVFGGADEALLNKESGVKNLSELKTSFWRETTEQRRAALMPFTWNVVAKQGQLYGDRNKGSDAHVTNGLKFSYPGYSETLCGFADPRINSNDYAPNPNVTVLEWLNRKPAFQGRVAAICAWDAFDRILNKARCGFFVNAGFEPMTNGVMSPQVELLNHLKQEEPRHWAAEPFDAVTFHTALEYFKQNKPRVFFLMLGETDNWGHANRYDEYLTAAHRADYYVKTLWETAQAMPQYRDKTTLIFLPDHGRGDAPTAWRSHGQKVDGAENIWIAFLGPDTSALGERTNVAAVTQNQVAATLAAFLHEDLCSAIPQTAKPITDAIFAAQPTKPKTITGEPTP